MTFTRTDVTCVESNDNKEYERAQGSYSDRIKISEKVEKIRNKMKYNSYNKQTECENSHTDYSCLRKLKNSTRFLPASFT